MDENSVVVPDQEIAFPSEELESEDSKAELAEAKQEDNEVAAVVLTRGWQVLLDSIQDDIQTAGDITQIADWNGNLDEAASLIGHAKFIQYLKGFIERVEHAATESGPAE